MTLTCPKCGKQIESASVNVAHDAAFCAPCGQVYKVSVLAAAAQGGNAAPAQAQSGGTAVPVPQNNEPQTVMGGTDNVLLEYKIANSGFQYTDVNGKLFLAGDVFKKSGLVAAVVLGALLGALFGAAGAGDFVIKVQ